MSFLKDYEPVEDRLREFWQQHPQGRVVTELLHHADGAYIVIARVYRGDELRDNPPAATGLARDAVDELDANLKRSALEVCETSAIGRALANLGYAPKGKRPSREEMQKSADLEPPVASEPTQVQGAEGMGEADGGGGADLESAKKPEAEVTTQGETAPSSPTREGGADAGEQAASPSPTDGSDASDMSAHVNKPHKWKSMAPDFPDYEACTVGTCRAWRYVGKDKG